jgi:hypothetical protein
MTGAVVGGRCYPVAQDAQDAYYGSFAEFSYVSGTSVEVVTYVPSGGAASGWARLVTAYPVGGGSSTGSVSTDQDVAGLPSCDVAAQLADGAALGWLFASALIAVAAFKLMGRAAT